MRQSVQNKLVCGNVTHCGQDIKRSITDYRTFLQQLIIVTVAKNIFAALKIRQCAHQILSLTSYFMRSKVLTL